MKKKLLNPLVLAGIAALSLMAIYFSLHAPKEKPPGSEAERIARLAGMDRQNLIKKDASENEVFAALVRLAQQRIPEARQEAIRRSKSESRVVRGGVANALGYFDDSESTTVLERLLKDSDVSVRVQAIYAVGRRGSANKEKTLLGILGKSDLSSEEKVAVYTNLLQGGAKDAHNQALQSLISEVKQASSLGLKLQAFSTLIQTVPKDPKVIELYRFILTDSKLQALVPVALKQLAVIKDPGLDKRFNALLGSKDPVQRSSAIQLLHQLCLPERWSVLTDVIKNDKDQTVRNAAIQEARAMPGGDAVRFMKTALESGMFRESETGFAKQVLSELVQNPGADPCPSVKK